MSSHSEMILKILMLDLGIIPFAPHLTRSYSTEEMNLIDKRIENLEPAQRRMVKRKFRKLWRKSVRFLDDRRTSLGRSQLYRFTCGLNTKEPSPAHRRARRAAVVMYLQHSLINDVRW